MLSIDTNASWVRKALASGAVVVDPTVEETGSQACTITSEAPGTSYCAATTVQVGYDGTHQEHHGLLKFGVSGIPVGAKVLNAKLGLYVQSHSTSTAKAVGVYRVTKPWTTSATWEKYDGTHAWTAAGGDYSNPTENSDASVNPSVGVLAGWSYWYPTKMVQEWVNTVSAPEKEGYANEGLIVKDQTDNATANLLTIASPTAAADRPFLEVRYEPRGFGSEPQYTQLSTPLTDKLTMSINPASGNMMLQNQDLHTIGTNGVDFSEDRTFNELNPEYMGDARWEASNRYRVDEFSDGSELYYSTSGGFFIFIKQANGTFITPPGIKATFCTAAHPPCPESLPSGVASRLIFNQSQSYIDFTSSGEGIHVSDRYGNLLTASFKEGHNPPASWTDTQGRKFEYAFLSGSSDFYTELKDVAGSRHVSYSYEAPGTEEELTSYTDAAGNTTKYHYENYQLDQVTTPNGAVIKLGYYSDDRIHYFIRTANAEHTTGPKTEFVYYKLGEAPAPCTSTQLGTVVKDPDWSAAKAHETLYCSNVLDEVEKVVDASGNEAKQSFDPVGNTISSTAAAREASGSAGVTSFVYGTGGQNLECEVQGTTEPQTKCPTGAMSKGYSTSYAYGDTSFPYQASEDTSALQQKTKLCYWGGSIECMVEGEGASGGLKQQTLPLTPEAHMSYTYNSKGLPTSTADPDNHKTSYEYDATGNLKTIIAPTLSKIGKRTITVDSDSRAHTITQCLVESGGSCTSSEVATLSYDSLDRLTEAVYTGPGTTKTFKYTYDANGNLEKRIDPTGTTNFKYDPLNRLTEEELPGSLTNAYTYDEASNLTSFIDAGGTTKYFYDGLNQAVEMYEPGGSCKEPLSKCTKFEYDKGGSLIKTTYPSSATLNYTIDPTTGRPTAISAKKGSETLISHTYAYLNGSNDTPLIFKDTLELPGTGTSETIYKYDPLDRLTEATIKSSAAALKGHYFYELGPGGNRKRQEVSTTSETGGEKTTFLYNPGDELECRVKSGVTCTKTAETEVSGYSYDGAGSETAITGYADPATTAFAYNNLNQLKALTPPSLTEQAASYVGSGQTSLTALGSTTLQNSGLGLTRQTNESGTSRYARSPAGLLIDERLPTASYNPVYDATGSIIGLLNTSGELKQAIRYGPFGENASASGSLTYSATTDPFGFQAGFHLLGGNAGSGNIPNGLYHFGERYYDPSSGRWTQRDPLNQIASPNQSNRYVFAESDPVNRQDPTGEVSGRSFCVAVAIAFCGVTNSGDDIRSYATRAGEQLDGYVEQATEFITPDEEELQIADEVAEDAEDF